MRVSQRLLFLTCIRQYKATAGKKICMERQIDINSINWSALQLIRELSNQLESSFIELESSQIK